MVAGELAERRSRFPVPESALAAESVAELEGVSSVSNQIKIRRKHGIDAKRQITTALHRHANIEASQIRVSVDDGKVILEGPSTLITSVVSLTRPSDQLAACAKSSITSR